METTNKEIGGNKFYLKLGKYFTKLGEKYTKKGSKTVISNPTCKLINPFSIMYNFTVDNNLKFQLIVQGDYKELYKEHGTEDNPIDIDKMFMTITHKQGDWFLKQ